jgi:hypothetical protein
MQTSSNQQRKQLMVPDPKMNRKVGPGYTSEVIEFGQRYWRAQKAVKQSESLMGAHRALVALRKEF